MTDYRLFLLIIILLLLSFPLQTFSQERTIQPGDAIEISVSGNESLTQTVLVNPDGMIDYPALQGLPIDGLTLQRFQEIAITRLSKYMESIPLVLVRFSESYPIKVTVLGQIVRPGLYTIPNTATIQGAISAAGGFVSGAQLSKIKLIRKSNADPNQEIVNMEKFYLEGDPSLLPSLKNDDTIVVTGNPLATHVKVIGCVENPGSYEVFFQTSILDAIFLAGGTTDEADLKHIKIVSFARQASREAKINIERLLKLKDVSSIPTVVPGDVIFVPKKAMNWKQMVSLIRDVTTVAMLYYIIARSKNL